MRGVVGGSRKHSGHYSYGVHMVPHILHKWPGTHQKARGMSLCSREKFDSRLLLSNWCAPQALLG